LPTTIDAIVACCGVAAERGVELGLGEWIAVGGRMPSGLGVEFIHYPLAPAPRGVNVRVDIQAPMTAALEEVLAILGMARGDALWISPFVA
jgi:hypothetical protein